MKTLMGQTNYEKEAINYFYNNNFYKADEMLDNVSDPTEFLKAVVVYFLDSEIYKPKQSLKRFDLIALSRNWWLLAPVCFIASLFYTPQEKIFYKKHKWSLTK